MPFLPKILLRCLLLLSCTLPCYLSAQVELMPWGNIIGQRVEGQLLPFETSIQVAYQSWDDLNGTGKERQRPRYTHQGNVQTVRTRLDSLFVTETLTLSENSPAQLRVHLSAHADTTVLGTFFRLELPAATFGKAGVTLMEPGPSNLGTIRPDGKNVYLRMRARGITLSGDGQTFSMETAQPIEFLLRKTADNDTLPVQLYLRMLSGKLQKGDSASLSLTLHCTGQADHSPATVVVNPASLGAPFQGLGGNFRIQNPRQDPMVIDYCLQNLDVRFGRVEMPWMLWHRVDSLDPLVAARKGTLHRRVSAAMEMARRLDKLGMPVVVSAWWAPEWAFVGPKVYGQQPDGSFGNPLRQERKEEIYASITSYLLFLKEKYGVEAAYFSFNESDLGIDVRQTAEEHTLLIRELGAYFASKGLNTKLLLGDTGDANGWPFIQNALSDSTCYPYIGAVSFHSWRGWETATLQKWRDAADQLGVPLMVGEGSIDAAAWGYPDAFLDPVYALEEINLYVRLLAICQPVSILQWQLTTDYSPVIGGGLFGNNTLPLSPTQRFWNLKQLGQTPANLPWIFAETQAPALSVAALYSPSKKKNDFALHLVNQGASRPVTITGLPESLKTLQVWITDVTRGMESLPALTVENGTVSFDLPARCFVTMGDWK